MIDNIKLAHRINRTHIEGSNGLDKLRTEDKGGNSFVPIADKCLASETDNTEDDDDDDDNDDNDNKANKSLSLLKSDVSNKPRGCQSRWRKFGLWSNRPTFKLAPKTKLLHEFELTLEKCTGICSHYSYPLGLAPSLEARFPVQFDFRVKIKVLKPKTLRSLLKMCVSPRP